MTTETKEIATALDALTPRMAVPVGELFTTPASQAAIAEVHAACVLARSGPRNESNAITRLRALCDQPQFAQTAIYRLPRGREIDEHTGRFVPHIVKDFTVGFSEQFSRIWGNLREVVQVVADDEERRLAQVVVWDLETNYRAEDSLSFAKVVERRSASVGDGDVVVSERRTKSGSIVYLVEATPTQVEEQQAALAARKLRNLRLRHLPLEHRPDLWARCMAAQVKALGDRKAVLGRIAAFLKTYNINPDQIAARFGCELDAMTPEQVVDLRGIALAIREGDAKAPDYFLPPPSKPKSEAGAAKADQADTAKGDATSQPAASSGQSGRSTERQSRQSGRRSGGPSPAAGAAAPAPAPHDPPRSDAERFDWLDHLGARLAGGSAERGRTVVVSAAQAIGVASERDHWARPELEAIWEKLRELAADGGALDGIPATLY